MPHLFRQQRHLMHNLEREVHMFDALVNTTRAEDVHARLRVRARILGRQPAAHLEEEVVPAPAERGAQLRRLLCHLLRFDVF